LNRLHVTVRAVHGKRFKIGKAFKIGMTLSSSSLRSLWDWDASSGGCLMAAPAQPPKWFADFELERRATSREEDRLRQQAEYRRALMADAIRESDDYAKRMTIYFNYPMDLSPADFAALRATAIALAAQFGAIESALRYSEAIQ
jgi:hypothetical protein